MLKFALFFDMMKHWNDGGGVEKAMNFRRRDATRNTQHESGALRIPFNHITLQSGPTGWTRTDRYGHTYP
jgi:hypothetical protein